MLVLLGLLVFGPRRLPQLGRQAGGLVVQLRRAMNDFKGTLDREVALDEVKEAAKQVHGLTSDARQMTRDLMGQVGAPPAVDPTRLVRNAAASLLGKEAVKPTSETQPPKEETPATDGSANPAGESGMDAAEGGGSDGERE